MKILFLAHRTPYPPNKGEKIRAFHILSRLVENHDVSLVYWLDDQKDREHVTLLKELCRGGSVVPLRFNRPAAVLRAFRSLIRGKSFSEGYFYDHNLQSEIDGLINRERYDLVYIFSSTMACSLSRWPEIPRVVDFVDVDSDKWKQLAGFTKFPKSYLYRLEYHRLLKFEIETSARALANLFVSDAEAKLFQSLGGHGPMVVIPNGVDLGVRPTRRRESIDVLKLIFVGTMNYYPNEDAAIYFANQILPIVKRQFPNATFEIVGRSPTRSLQYHHGKQGIKVLGEVDDVRAHLLRSDVSVAPMRVGRGVQNKVLEAMAVGIPVVATSGALKGMTAVKDDEVLIGDTPERFAEQIVRLFTNPKLYENTVSKAYSRVAEDYSWNTISKKLLNLLDTDHFDVIRPKSTILQATAVPS